MVSFGTVLLFGLLYIGSRCDAYNILILHPMPFFSIQRPILALTEKLIEKGHNVTLLGPNPVPNKSDNYTFIDLSIGYNLIFSNNNESENILKKPISRWDTIKIFDGIMDSMLKIHSSEPFLQFLRRVEDESSSFDVVLVHSIILHFLTPMAHVIAGPKPIIAFTTNSIDFLTENEIGSIQHFSFMPSIFSGYSNKMSLLEKIDNWFSHHYIRYKIRNNMIDKSKEFFRRSFGKAIEELVVNPFEKISLCFTSSNHVYYYPRLLAPNVIELGPLHIKEPSNLPQDLQDWLDGTEKGVIYFSLGSNVKSKSLPPEVIQNFLKLFRELPTGYRVLWKWESDKKMEGQPENVLTQKWLPQLSVLAHPKVKLFVTQGGLQSFQETVHYGKPTIVIPWFADQSMNSMKMVDAGIGVRLLPKDLFSHEKVRKAVHDVLFDASYTKNAQRLSDISHDFTARSGETAVFWVEHIARHGGGTHLKPVTADTTYFQYFCLDLLVLVLFTTSVLLYAAYSVLKFLLAIVSRTTNGKMKQS